MTVNRLEALWVVRRDNSIEQSQDLTVKLNLSGVLPDQPIKETMKDKPKYSSYDEAYSAMDARRGKQPEPVLSDWAVMVAALKAAEAELGEYYDYEPCVNTVTTLVQVREAIKLADSKL